jgi:hypothetical protein
MARERTRVLVRLFGWPTTHCTCTGDSTSRCRRSPGGPRRRVVLGGSTPTARSAGWRCSSTWPPPRRSGRASGPACSNGSVPSCGPVPRIRGRRRVIASWRSNGWPPSSMPASGSSPPAPPPSRRRDHRCGGSMPNGAAPPSRSAVGPPGKTTEAARSDRSRRPASGALASGGEVEARQRRRQAGIEVPQDLLVVLGPGTTQRGEGGIALGDERGVLGARLGQPEVARMGER